MTVRVTSATLRKGGVCLFGAKRMCPTLGVDFRRLVTEGYPVEELEGIKDVTVQRLIAIARADAEGTDGRRR